MLAIINYTVTAYSQEIWRGIKSGSLAVYICNRQIKSPKISSCIYAYGDSLLNCQI